MIHLEFLKITGCSMKDRWQGQGGCRESSRGSCNNPPKAMVAPGGSCHGTEKRSDSRCCVHGLYVSSSKADKWGGRVEPLGSRMPGSETEWTDTRVSPPLSLGAYAEPPVQGTCQPPAQPHTVSASDITPGYITMATSHDSHFLPSPQNASLP